MSVGWVSDQVESLHPTHPHITGVPFITLHHEPEREDSLYCDVHVFSDGKMDRSPGGTEATAMVATFESRGRIRIGQRTRSEGLFGNGRFEGCALRETSVGNPRALVVTINGAARIIGYAKWLIDRNRPGRRRFRDRIAGQTGIPARARAWAPMRESTVGNMFLRIGKTVEFHLEFGQHEENFRDRSKSGNSSLHTRAAASRGTLCSGSGCPMT